MGTRSRQQPSSVSCYATATYPLLKDYVVGLIFSHPWELVSDTKRRNRYRYWKLKHGLRTVHCVKSLFAVEAVLFIFRFSH
jgi:hypothetical protein